MPKRAKGRPALGDGDLAGRDRLIQAARTLMRRRQRVDLPRREVAAAADATPGLVTYHFPTELSLVEAAAKPVIDMYLGRLVAMLDEEVHPSLTFRRLILLFLEIAREHGLLLDSYIVFVKANTGSASTGFLTASYQHLTRFLKNCEASGFIKPVDPAFCQSLIWGVCKTVAQSDELCAMLAADLPDRSHLPERQADMILGIVLDGMRR